MVQKAQISNNGQKIGYRTFYTFFFLSNLDQDKQYFITHQRMRKANNSDFKAIYLHKNKSLSEGNKTRV